MSIVSRIESIEGHIGDIYDSLELGGSDLTNVDKNIVNINTELMGRYRDYLANGTDELWNNWDNTSVTGVNEATLNNTIQAKMKMDLKGNTEQATRSGINLLNPNNLVVASPFVSMDNNNVLTVEINSTGYFKLAFDDLNLPADTYTIYCEILSGTYTGGNLCFFDLNDTQISGEFAFKNTTIYPNHIYTLNCLNGLNQLKFYQPYCSTETKIKLWIVKGTYSTMPSYEQYGVSPSPEFPSPVNNITGDVEVKVQNKNLFNKDNYLYYNGYFVDLETATISSESHNKIVYIPCLPNTAYTVSKIISKRFGIGYTTEVPANNVTVYDTSYDYSSTSLTITTGNNAKYLVAYIRNGNVSGEETLDNIINSLQIEQNSTATTYIPHAEQNYLLSLGNLEFAGIGDYKDKIFKAITGDTIYDSLTSEQKAGLIYGNWYKYGAIGKVIFDGSESWNRGSNGAYYLSVPMLDYLKISATICKSSHFIGSANTTGSSSVPDNKIAFYYGDITTINEFYCAYREKATLEDFKTWLSTHNIIVYYVLETPVTTQITDTTLINQLNALEQAYSYNEQTNISQEANLPFILDVTALIELS